MAAALLPVWAHGQVTLQSNWNQLSATGGPSARYGTQMTYDATHSQTVLFGGSNNVADTWLFDGSTWTQVNTTTTPVPRLDGAMVYDAAHGKAVMFGGLLNGLGNQFTNDTWLWDGSNWTNATPSNPDLTNTTWPGPRDVTAMAYDAAHGNVVLFGGSVGGSRGGDTWIWNGSTWTKISPINSPPARAAHSMAYDPVHGQVVLFGGYDANLQNLNDTWVWDGTTWTQKTPGTSVPPARIGAAMAFDAALGEIVLFGGQGASGYLNDTWAWDGANWTQLTPVNNPPSREVFDDFSYDAARRQFIVFGGYTGGVLGDTWQYSTLQNFGNVNVCPVSASTPAPCSVTLPLTFNVAATTNFGVAQVVTQGASGLDFSLASSTCASNVNAGATCTVNVKFAPKAPGLRMGAVNLVDSSNNLLVSTPIYGVGQAPQISFTPSPAVGTTYPTGGTAGPTSLVSPNGITTDAAGNLYIANAGEASVVKVSNGVSTTVGSGFKIPQGVAVDGAGNLYVADPGLNSPNGEVVEIPAGCTTAACQIAVYAPVVHPSPEDVAVDGLGNLYISDDPIGVIEIPANGGAQTTVYSAVGSHPAGIAVDASGAIFVADWGLQKVVKVPAGCTVAACQTTVGTGWVGPRGVAVDAAGDVVVSDTLLNGGEVVEVPAGCGDATCQIKLFSGLAYRATYNAAGEILISEQSPASQILQVSYSVPPAEAFSATYLGYPSSDSPQSVLIQDTGNQPLNSSGAGLAISDTSNFSQSFPGLIPDDCSPLFGLPPGSACNISINFTPQTIGLHNASVTLTDNALNGNPSTQSIPIAGVGLGPLQQLSIQGGGTGSGFVQSNPTGINCNVINSVLSGTCSAQFNSNQAVSLQAVPTGGSVFTGWGGACQGFGTDTCQLTLNVPQQVIANFDTAPPALDLVVAGLSGSGTGTVSSSPASINCFTGNPAGCQGYLNDASQVTFTATPAMGSYFAGWGGACSGTNPTCTTTVVPGLNVSAAFAQQSFGNVNVCPSGQSTPAPCSGTLTIPFTIPANTTLGATQVVTQGTVGLDFALGTHNTCTGTVAGTQCSVDVVFTPLAPGLRSGAVTLYDSLGNQVATQDIYGVGQAPLASFGPPAVAVVNTTASYPLTVPNGVAVDAVGNLYIVNTNLSSPAASSTGSVVKVGANGTVSTVGSGLNYPQGVAVDGAGNLFIADNNLNQVVEVTPAGVQTAMNFGLNSQLGVAVDGAGNLFVSSFNMQEVIKAPAGCTTAACTTVVYTAPAGLNPVGLATDAAGDLFVADFSFTPGAGQVIKIPVGCTTANCQVQVGTGWSQPEALAVDAAGDVFVADELPAIVEVPANCASAACQITVSNVLAFGIAVDSNGNVIIADRDTNSAADPNSGKVIVLSGSKPPNLNFAITNAGATSTDSPQAVTLRNIGNQPLAGTLALSGLTSNFSGSADCASFSLAPGEPCVESFTFNPQTTGYFTGVAAFSDNTMNLAASITRQQVNLTGIGGVNGVATTTAVPNVIGLTQAAAGTALTNSGLATGTINTASNDVVPAGSVIASNPAAGTQVALSSAVKLLVSSGPGQPPAPNPLSLLNNYFVTGDYVSAGVNFHAAAAVNGQVAGTINIAASTGPGSGGVPTGADLIDGFLYWMTVESSPSPSGANATFLGYGISGQQIGKDQPYTDQGTQGTLRVYRANVNAYFQNGANGIRVGSGAFAISLPGNGTNGVLLTEGASLVVIYRVLSPNFPLKSIVIYDGAAVPTAATTQVMKGFYDAAGGLNGNITSLFVDSSGWNNSGTSAFFNADDSQYTAQLNTNVAYGALILSTPVNNPDNDGILAAWKAGPVASDFHGGEPGYYDVKTGLWVALPGAKAGQKDLFVQLDYMCGGILSDGSCDPSKENLFPSPDVKGNDPLMMVQQAFANSGIALHLQVGNAVPEDTCTDSNGQLCQFPGQPGVVGWKNSLLFSKVWPRNLQSCASGGDCSPRFAYGQKDSYHYVLFGHSLAIPAWNTRYGSLVSINAIANGQTTITTTNRGDSMSINYCPSRITISGVQGAPGLNGVYNTASCPDSSTIIIATPAAVTANWSYPNNTLPEPIIGITSGTVTSISGYSDLGGADSAVTLGLWETSKTQDMSKRANVIAGTLFHELGHTIGLGHGGLYYDAQPTGSYVPTFEANCKPNYQSIMNYLFQLDGIGQGGAIAFSNQTLTTLTQSSLGSVSQLVDTGVGGAAATFPTSSWYVSTAPTLADGTTPSAATLHCDGAPLGSDVGYRITGSIAPITPPWTDGQNITFDGQPYSTLRGFNDLANIDLRQVGATGGQFAALASVLAFGSSYSPLNIAPGGSVAVGPGGTVTLGKNGTVTLGGGGNVTIPSGGSISGGGTITFGTGGNVTLGAGGTIAPGSNGTITVSNLAGNVTLGAGGTITLGGGGTVTLGAGGATVTLSGGGTITLGGGGSITVPPAGGSYTVPADGTISFTGSGGTVTLGAGGTVTLGGGGNVTLGGGGNITLGGGGNITLGAGGTVTLGGGGTVTLGGGGNVTLGAGGTITLGAGGNVTLGGGGTVTLGGGGTVTLGAGGDISVGAGGNVTLGAGGTVTLGAGGTVTLGAGGNVTLGAGGTITLGGGGTVTLGGGGTVTLGAGGTVTFPAGGGSIGGTTYGAGAQVQAGPNSSVTFNAAGGQVQMTSAGGNVTLGGGGNVTLGGGGTITLGGGGTVTLGGGGNVTLGGGGVVTLGGGGNITLGAGGNITLGGGGNVTLGGGGASTAELDYNAANSIVRPPPAASYTQVPSAVRVDWTAPAFGVVQTYTISRSVNGGPAVVIGSVSGVNGNPPATTFFDTNPATSGTVVYTISTTLVPDPGTNTQRQSLPSPPAVLTYDQTIQLDPLPSSVSIASGTLPVSATALSNGIANQQTVTFAATGPCSVSTSMLDTSTGKSTATVALNGTGSCTITASQAGDGTGVPLVQPAYNAADPVSGTFAIVSADSNVSAQTISFPQLANVQYGSAPVSISATASPSNFTVSFSTSGPCTLLPGNQIRIDGAGICKVTASSPSGAGSGNTTYSSASVTQSFNIAPAPLTVTAGNLTVAYGQAIPSLASDYTITGYVNGETSAVLNSTAPAISTTATSSSAPGAYPITVSTGNLAATNYSFIYVPGTLTIKQASATISINNIPAAATYGGSFTPTYQYSGNGSPTESTTSSTTAVCTVAPSGLVSFVGVGQCTLTPSATATTDYSQVMGSPQTFNVGKAAQSITFNLAATVTYGVAPITLSATSTSTLPVTFSIDGSSTAPASLLPGNQLKVLGTGTVIIDAIQAGNANYQPAQQVQGTIVVKQATLTVAANNLSRVYGAPNPPLAVTYSGFVNGDTATSALSGAPSLSTTAVATSLPGQYPITVTQGTLAARNYAFSFVNGTLTVTASGAVPPSGTACNGAYTGTFKGNLTVSKGQTCIFIGGGTTGSITGTGGSILLQGATVGSSVTIQSGGMFNFGPNGSTPTTIRGNLTVQSLPKSTVVNQVCGSTITGSVVYQSNGAPAVIGSGTSSCALNSIGGSLQVSSNSAAVTMNGDKVAGSIQVQSNTGATQINGNTVGVSVQDQSNSGATQIFNNTITNALQCSSNAAITGGGNKAAVKQGQCAKF